MRAHPLRTAPWRKHAGVRRIIRTLCQVLLEFHLAGDAPPAAGTGAQTLTFCVRIMADPQPLRRGSTSYAMLPPARARTAASPRAPHVTVRGYAPANSLHGCWQNRPRRVQPIGKGPLIITIRGVKECSARGRLCSPPA